MLQSFYTAFTGLSADKKWLSVISDNIANVNTVGYKAENAVFEDLLARSLTTFKNGAPVNQEIGGGVFISATVKDFSQGTFMNTNNPLDLALDGEGFFMVKAETGGTYYTRNGQFRLDANGDLINMLGMKVQGWMLDENGNMAGTIGNINIPMNMDPKSTTYMQFDDPSNLDSRAKFIEDDPNTPNIDESVFNPGLSTTYNYSNSIDVYDSLGNPHTLTTYFIHKKDNNDNSYWLAFMQIDDKSFPIKLGPYEYAFTKLAFKADGTLDTGKVEAYGEVDRTVYFPNYALEGSAGNYIIDKIVNDNGTVTTQYSSLVPGNVEVSYTVNNNKVMLMDDGKGNLIVVEDKDNPDNVGEIFGKVDYLTGTINITDSRAIDDRDGDGISDVDLDIKSSDMTVYSLSEIKDSEFQISLAQDEAILPGSVSFSYTDNLGNQTEVIDNGKGELINKETGEKIGTIDYSTGTIEIPGFSNGVTDTIRNINFRVYQDIPTDGTFYSVEKNLTGTIVSGTEVGDSSAQEVIKFKLTYRPIKKIPPDNLDQGVYPIKISGEFYDVTDPDSNGIANIVDPTTNNVVGKIDLSAGILWLYPEKVGQNATVDYIYYEPTGVSLNPQKVATTNIDFGNGSAFFSINVNYTSIKQVAADFMFYAEQDGNSKGDLMSLSVSEDGVIKATYTNGKVKGIARLAVANFKDKEMLVRKGSWLYVPNMQTYTPVIMPGGVISKIRSGMLEMSNVDIANEFIKLITAQRSYQANARVITTDDQILQETMNIKR